MNYSTEVQQAIKDSKAIAIGIKSRSIRPEHLFLALINDEGCEAYQILRDMNLNIVAIKQTLKDFSISLQLQIGEVESRKNAVIPLDLETEKILKNSEEFSKLMNSNEVESEHVFYSILDNNQNLVTELFKKSPQTFKVLMNRLKHEDESMEYENDDMNGEYDDMNEHEVSKEKVDKNSKTKLIDQFGTDMTKLAKEGKLEPVVGRKDEIKRISQILSRRKKNNPVLVGEPGVGKSAIVEGIAQLIVDGNVPESLLDKKVITLDMASLVSGTKYRGEFEQRLRSIIKEMDENRNIILFIDEIHTMIGAGSASGSLDAANMLKPALARGAFQCIGATTLDEYRKYIEKDGALERRFQKIVVEPTSKSETLEILKNIKDKYEEHHHVTYTEEALIACVDLTDKYMSEKFLPDKAIDALDEAGAKVHVNKTTTLPKKIQDLDKKVKKIAAEKEKLVNDQKFELAAEKRDSERILLKEFEKEKENWKALQNKNRDTVSKDDVAEVIALMTKIPVDSISSDENIKLKMMSEKVKGIVIGQDDAIDKLVRAVKRARIGIKDHKKPIGSFIFLGPTGVGKTYMAKILAKELFGSEESMIRIDMSEYGEKHNVSRLIGSPPGYVGYEDGGELTEAVRRKPYSIILLDEIEKAHPDVYNILLQLLDDGVLTDSYGRRVDFKNTIIIMTSNAGSRKLKEFGTGIGFNNGNDVQKDQNKIIEKELKKTFAPEFLNRIDEVIMFNSLSKENIGSIVEVEVKQLISRLKELGYDVNIGQSLKDFLYENGYDQDYGARPLKRAIQKYIEDRITDAILNEEIELGDKISLEYDVLKSEVTLIKQKETDIVNLIIEEPTSVE
jgi:ATP-dependent Clp protease ATP-binding subunit ClpC